MKSALFLLAFLCSSRLIQAKIKPALPCNQDKCRPPNCRCSDDFKPPGKLPVNKTPQIILLTFDDDLSTINYKQYQEVFYNRTNPNGCPTIGTFFVSHNYTSYYLVEEMYSQGHEVADHSVTHQTPTTYWIDGSYGMWKNESTAQREILHRFANVPLHSVAGFRAPFLALAENMYAALFLNGFTYDLSWPSGKYTNPPLYPYTLDFLSIQDCPIGICPKMSYPGLWVVPNIDLMNKDGTVCGSMMDACNPVGDEASWYEILHRNFHYHYDTNRAPFGLHMHSAWFGQRSPDHMDVLKKFLDYVGQMDEVWILSASQVISWMKDPQDTESAKSFKPWGCPKRPPPRCTNYNDCHYVFPQDFYMDTCTKCPKHFPSPKNPNGN